MMPTHPCIRDIAHGFDGAIAYPGHEITVKLECGTALVKQETSDVLRVPVIGINDCVSGDDAAVPIEIHAVLLLPVTVMSPCSVV
jgi:hypothetical protein